MAKYLGKNLSALVKQHVGPGVSAATLIKVAAGSRTPGQLTGGTNPTDTSYTCRGFIAEQARGNIPDSLVDAGLVTIVLIGDTISNGTIVPEVDDKITIEGSTYRIAEDGILDRDPSKATYTCVCRPN